VIDNINLEVREGEIVGIAGLMGAGRTELARAIFGVDPIDSGKIFVGGKEVDIRSPRDAIRAGLAFVTENRRDEGLFLEMSIGDNITYPILKQLSWALGFIDHRRKRSVAEKYVRELSVVPPSISHNAGTLSGGNQQKVVVGKWLSTKPRIIILDEPTRGVDVGAKVEIHTLMTQLVKQGVGILMISSELPEVLGMSD